MVNASHEEEMPDITFHAWQVIIQKMKLIAPGGQAAGPPTDDRIYGLLLLQTSKISRIR
jgi:hypothetical protein